MPLILKTVTLNKTVFEGAGKTEPEATQALRCALAAYAVESLMSFDMVADWIENGVLTAEVRHAIPGQATINYKPLKVECERIKYELRRYSSETLGFTELVGNKRFDNESSARIEIQNHLESLSELFNSGKITTLPQATDFRVVPVIE